MSQLLTSERVAALLAVEPRTVNAWARVGKIRMSASGSSSGSSEAELEAWIRAEHARNCQSSASEAEGPSGNHQRSRPLGDLHARRTPNRGAKAVAPADGGSSHRPQETP
jgi:hypothetical protein